MGVNDDLLDELTEHQIHLIRLSNATARKVLKSLKASEARIVERLLGSSLSGKSRARQEKLLDELRRTIEKAYVDATGVLQLDLDDLAVYEGEYQQDLFRRVLPVKFETVVPSAEQLVAAATARPFQGKLLKEVYQELSASAFKKVRDTIRLGYLEGRTTAQIVTDIRGRRSQGYKDGILQKSRREVETVVRTAVNHTANAAREHVYERNQSLVKGVRFNATLDSRTTLVCASNDGKVFEPGKGPRPPLHFNCRSSTSPVLKSWRELGFDVDEVPAGTRASMDGQVPADMTYEGWLRKKPASFQDEVLGPRRGELFRNGMSIDRFTDRGGRGLSLGELREREKSGSDRGGPGSQRRVIRGVEIDEEMRRRVIKMGRKHHIEHLEGWDMQTGRKFTPQKGVASDVVMSDEMIAAALDHRSRLVVHHNHPSSSSFSPRDLKTFASMPGIERLYAHGHNGDQFLVEMATFEAASVVERHAGLAARVQKAINSYILSKKDANIGLSHLSMIRAHNEGYARYSFDAPKIEAAARRILNAIGEDPDDWIPRVY